MIDMIQERQTNAKYLNVRIDKNRS